MIRALALALAMAAAPAVSRAQPETHGPRSGSVERSGGDAPAPSTPPRPIPDYGRPPPAPDPAEALLWIPRVLFFPLHLVLEYGVRRPIGWLLRTIELERLDALFVQGMPQLDRPEGEWGFVPLLRYDHGFAASVGLGFRVHDAARSRWLRVRIEGWPMDQLAGLARGTLLAGSARVTLELSGGWRDDRVYHGLGWSTSQASRARYAHARGDASLFVEVRPWRRSRVAGGVRAGVHRFGDSDFAREGDLSIEQAIARGEVTRPPGYPQGYTLVEPWVRAVLDSRDPEEWPHASGARVELGVGWGVDAEQGVASSWARTAARVDLALEVMRDRTLRLRGMTELVFPLAHRAIPFTEQVWLGGPLDRMPGFLLGRLIGESAATMGLSWRYAIWSWMDAELFVDVGNVFGPHLRDFDVDRLRVSFGTALVTSDPEDFSLLVAFGTEPFVLGAGVSSVRFAMAIGAPP